MRFSHADYIIIFQSAVHTRRKPKRIKRTAIRTGKIAVALPGIGFDLFFGEIAKLYAVCSIDVPGNNGNLLFDGEVQVVEEFELGFALAGNDQSFRQLSCTGATFSPVIADNGGICAASQSLLSDELKFSGGIRATLPSATTIAPNNRKECRTQSD